MELGKDFPVNIRGLGKMKIDVNGPDISEIIVKEKNGRMFLNNETREISDNVYDFVRKDRRFVIVEPCKNGYYLYNDKEHDLLCIVFVKLDVCLIDNWNAWSNCRYSWVETDRIFLTRDGNMLSSKQNFPGAIGAIDICGQAALEAEGKEECKNACFFNYNVGGKQTAFEFFGGIMSYYNTSKINSRHTLHFNDIGGLVSVFKVYHDFIGNKSFDHPFHLDGGILNIDCNLDGESENVFLFDYLDIPEAALAAMKRFVMAHLLNYLHRAYRRGERVQRCEENYYELSIIQKYKGCAIQRFFEASVIAKYPIEESEIVFTETTRKWFHKHMKEKSPHTHDAVLMWCEDDLTGTILQYTKPIIDDLIAMKDAEMDNFEKSSNPEKYFWDIIDDYDAAFEDKYGVSSSEIIKFVADMGQYPVVEKLINKIYSMMENEKDSVGRDKLKACLQYNIKRICEFGGLMQFLNIGEVLFGPVDDSKKDLHKVFDIPKALFNWLIRENKTQYIREFKTMFSKRNEDYDYFLSMNDKACHELADYVFRSNPGDDEEPVYAINDLARKRFVVLENLITRNGTKNLGKYITFLKKIEATEYFACYLNYTYLLADDAVSQRGFFKDAPWNLTAEALEKTFESFQKTNSLLLAEKEMSCIRGIDEINRKFSRLSDEWKKYCYEDGIYQVSYPKGPIDLIIEGINLNHCAKNFISIVSQGQTTVLFLRNKAKPDKPFYTIEVRDGAIRQCHGFNNRAVEEESDIEMFLKKFCVEKGITWERGEKALGPHGQ